MTEFQEGPSKYRSLRGWQRQLEVTTLAVITVTGALWAADVPAYLGLVVLREQYLGLFWALVLAAVYLGVPATPSAPRTHVPWYDWIAVGASLVVGFNVVLFYPRLLYESALPTPDKYLLGACSLLLLMEATRRLVGRALLGVLLVFLAYGATAEYMPGLLNGNGATLERLSIYLYLDTNALLGLPLTVASSIVLAFVLLGQVLFATGGGAFFTDLAMAAMGRYRGGPAKIAVVASTLFGTISGTAVSNVVTTGIITIPMMRRNGYRKEMAAAVEAVASTGGQIMPPVMGAAAFLLAEFLEVPYRDVVLAALIPALIYYLLLFIQVDLEAAKRQISGLAVSELPRLGAVMRRGWVFLLPLVALVYALFWLNFRPGKAGLLAVGVLVAVVVLLRRKDRPSVAQVTNILADTGRSLLEIGLITGIAGIVIGVLNLTGLGFSISLALVQIGGGSLIALLVLCAIMSIVLGMGMPTVSVYILLAVLIAPSLEKLGLQPMAAHLFILYFGLLSMITPPVAIASYAAAAVAGSNPMHTAWESVRLGAMAYVVPFIFIFSPELLLQGTVFDVLWSVLSTSLGAFWIGIGLTGYLFRTVSPPLRALFLLCALALFFDHLAWNGLGYPLNVGGAVIGAALWSFERVQAKRGVRAPAVVQASAAPAAEQESSQP